MFDEEGDVRAGWALQNMNPEIEAQLVEVVREWLGERGRQEVFVPEKDNTYGSTGTGCPDCKSGPKIMGRRAAVAPSLKARVHSLFGHSLPSSIILSIVAIASYAFGDSIFRSAGVH